MNVYKKLQQARLKLQSATLKKSGKNRFAGYEYFELADFLPTIQTIFAEVGLCGTVSFGTEIATLTIVDVDATDNTQPNFVVFSSPMSTAELKGCHAIQNLGAVQTYLRRYLWVAAMEIVEHDALDATTGSDSKKVEPTVESPRIVGVETEWRKDKIGWIIDAPDYMESDAIAWLNLIQDSTETFLGMCTKTEDVMSIFKKNKVLFDKLKEVDPETFKKLMEKFTETKTKLEEKANG
jgi:ERF superfamily